MPAGPGYAQSAMGQIDFKPGTILVNRRPRMARDVEQVLLVLDFTHAVLRDRRDRHVRVVYLAGSEYSSFRVEGRPWLASCSLLETHFRELL